MACNKERTLHDRYSLILEQEMEMSVLNYKDTINHVLSKSFGAKL